MIILGLVFIVLGIATFITGNKRSKDTWTIMEDYFEDEILDDGSDMMIFGVVISLIGLVLVIYWVVVNRYKIRSFFKSTIRRFKRWLREPKKKKKRRHSELYYSFYYYKHKIKKFFKRKKRKDEKNDNKDKKNEVQ